MSLLSEKSNGLKASLLAALFFAGIVPAPLEARDWDLSHAYTVTNGARVTHSLNTFWQFSPCEQTATNPPAKAEDWGWFLVPGRWRGAGHGNLMHDDAGREQRVFGGRRVEEYPSAWYRRTFATPADCAGRTSRLYFERVDSRLELWLNGEPVALPSRHPGGRVFVDVTGRLKSSGANELLARVTMDEKGVRSYSAGFRGNVWLETRPHAGFGDPVVRPLFRENRLALRFAGGELRDGEACLARRIVDRADGRCVYADEVPYRTDDEIPFAPARAWSPSAPNLHDLELTAKGSDGKVLDRRTIRFGWRDFRADGGRFLLNGKPVDIFAETGWPTSWTMAWNLREDYVRRAFRAMKAMNVTAVYVNPELVPDAFFDWADEEGFLLLYHAGGVGGNIHEVNPETYCRRFVDWAETERDSPSAVNHPSLVGLLLDVWYNYHDGTKNPAFIGLCAEEDPNLTWRQPTTRRQELERLAEAGHRAFPELETFTGADGHVRNVYGTHIYHTWGAPAAELSALFANYSKSRRIPVFAGEMCLPYFGSFSDLRNWRNDSPMYTENAARFLGHRAASIRDVHAEFAATGPDNDLLAGTSARDPSDGLRHLMLSELYSRTLSEYLEATVFPWRYDGVSGIGFFEYLMSFHLVAGARDIRNRDFVRGADLTAPGDKSELLWGSYQRPFFDLDGDEIGLRPNYATVPFLAATDPVTLAIVGGGDRYAVDHAFFAGETLEKGVAFVNAAGTALRGRLDVHLVDAARGVRAATSLPVAVPAYSNVTFAVGLKMPEVAVREAFMLKAVFTPADASDANLSATLAVQVFPPVDVQANRRTAVKLVGATEAFAREIGRLGFVVDGQADAPVTVFAPHALESAEGRDAFAAALGSGARVLALEQGRAASPELKSARARRAFVNAAAHPVLAGLDDVDFANWRGDACSVAPYGEIRAGCSWTDWGARNIVAAHVFRRPVHGNVKALLVSGFDLRSSPLLEYRTDRATWIASQLEIGSKLGKDPVATHLFVRLVRYLAAAARPEPSRVAFFGSDRMYKLFRTAGVEMTRQVSADTLTGFDTVIVAEPDARALRRAGVALARHVYNGGNVFCLHGDGDFSSAWLPFVLTTGGVVRTTKAAVKGIPDSVWLNGWGAEDLYWNAEVDVPTFANVPDLAEATSPAVLVQYRYGRGRYVLTTLTPDLFGKGPKELLSKPAIGKTDGVLSTLLTSLGARIEGDEASGPYRENLSLQGDLTYRDWSFSEDGTKWISGQTTVVGERVRADAPWSRFLERDPHGTGWYRVDFDLATSVATRRDLLFIAHFVRGADNVWLNGRQIGEGGDRREARVYHIPQGLLRAGTNELRIRLDAPDGGGGLCGSVGIHTPDPKASRVWSTPWPEGVKRDYTYPCDMIRFY